MSALAEKLRRARESTVEVSGHKFTIRRPTQLEVVEIQNADGGLNLRNSFRFVVDWEMSELDLGVPGGTDEHVTYDPEAFMEWVADHPEAWPPLLSAITDSFRNHEARLDGDAKNS